MGKQFYIFDLGSTNRPRSTYCCQKQLLFDKDVITLAMSHCVHAHLTGVSPGDDGRYRFVYLPLAEK